MIPCRRCAFDAGVCVLCGLPDLEADHYYCADEFHRCRWNDPEG